MPDLVNSGSITLVDGTGGVNPPAGSSLDIGVEDHPAVSLDLEGAFTATLVIEATAELGPATDWFTPVVLSAAGVAASASLTAATRRFISAAGLARVRLRCTAFTSGPITATLRAGQGFVSAGGGGGGGGAVTVGDGADIAQGTTTDAGIITNIAGTVIGFLRGGIIQWAAFLARFPAALVGGRLDVNVGATGVTQPVSGTVTANAGTGTLAVSAAALPLPAGAATETTLAAASAKLPAALVNGALVNTGDTAHGVTDAGNPMEIGFGAVAHGANPAAVTAGQRTRGYANRAGVPFVIGGHPNVQTIGVNFATAQTDTAIITVATGTKIVVTGFLVTLGSAATANVPVRLGFGTASTPAYGSAQLLGGHPNVAAGSGFGRGGGGGILGVGADDEDVRITSGVPTGDSLSAFISYYTVPS